MSEPFDVAIVGAGPAGAMLAIELGCRGVRTLLLEEDPAPPVFPKANATSARTMEHFRRRGFAQRVRASGLPPDRPQHVVYRTRVLGHELARFRIPAPGQAAQGTDQGADQGDYGQAWPTPELPHRGNQMFIEPILLDELRRYPSVDLRLGARVDAVQDHGPRGVTLQARIAGQAVELQARHVVGCDGARSVVREAMQVAYEGRSREERDFFGGQMLTIYFQSAELSALLADDPAWTYWVINPQRRGVLIGIDGDHRWVVGIQLAPGQAADQVDVAAVIAAVVGRPIAFTLIGTGPWLAGYMLVAERLRVGNLLLAGDAAHLFTPAAGMGYNTSIDDAVNLGWKLAASVQGWGDAEVLLDSYDTERRPIAHRNTAFARAMADSMGRLASPTDLEAEGPAGDAARADMGGRCQAHITREFNIPGLQLGVCYAGPLIANGLGERPVDDPHHYQPTATPGARAPHVAIAAQGLSNGPASLLDAFGRDFTLLLLAPGAQGQHWLDAAAALRLPLALLAVDDPAVRAAYAAPAVLIRPDHHVAWRGDAQADAAPVLAAAVGRRPH